MIVDLQQGHTAFHLAARNGHLSCLKLLFAAAEASHSLPSLPKMDKVTYWRPYHVHVTMMNPSHR